MQSAFFDHRLGFNLIEMLVVLIITTIISLISIPTYVIFNLQTQAEIIYLKFASVISFAQVEAIRTGSSIYVSAANYDKNSQLHYSGSDWSAGILVYKATNDQQYHSGNDLKDLTFNHAFTIKEQSKIKKFYFKANGSPNLTPSFVLSKNLYNYYHYTLKFKLNNAGLLIKCKSGNVEC